MLRFIVPAALTAAFGFALSPGTAAAQSFPTKPVRIIVPFAAGGGSDIVTRVLAQKLTEAWGTTVIVDNRPGAGGNIGMEIAAKLPPDGYTLVTGVFGPMAVNVSLFKSIGFDPVRDFTPITRLVDVTNLLVVHPSVPARSVKELIAVAKRHPGGLNYASGGSGTAGHLAAELFNSMAGVKMVHIAYKGSGLSMADLVAGQTALSFDNMPATWPHAKAGRLLALGVTTPKRTAAAPEVPTIAEAGLPGFEATNWYSLVGPAGMARALVERLHRDVSRAMSAADAKDRLAAVGAEVALQTPEQFAEFIRSEIDKWGKVIRTAGIRTE